MKESFCLAVDYRMYRASGIGTILSNLIPRLIVHCPDIHFYLLGNVEELEKRPELKASNVSLISCTAPIFSVAEQFELARKIPKDVDLFWAPHINVPLFWKGNLIVTVCDAFHLAMPELFRGWHHRLFARILFRHIRKRALRVITISEFSRSELIRLAGLAASKLDVVYCGIDDSWKQISTGEKIWPKPYYLYVGNIRPHKNLKRLIQAMSRLKNRVDHDLVVVGKMDGFLTTEKNLVEDAKELLGDRIHFTGAVDFKKLQQFYAQAAALVFPSLYEGFGLPPLESMACGVPAVVSSRASLPEICADAALYVDPEDVSSIAEAMYEVVNRPDIRAQLIQNGHRRAHRFCWNSSTLQTSEILYSTLPKADIRALHS